MSSFPPWFRWVASIVGFGIIFSFFQGIAYMLLEMFTVTDPAIQMSVHIFFAFPFIVILLATLNLFIDLQKPEVY